MGININSKILLSVASIAAAAALVIGATFAFFSDEETSNDNLFSAGTLDLVLCDVDEGDDPCPVEESILDSTTASFGAVDLAPGDSVGAGFVELRNTGSIDIAEVELDATATQTGGGVDSTLADKLNLTVTKGSNNDCSSGTDDLTDDIDLAIGNNATPLTMTELASATYDALPGLSVGSNYFLCMSVEFDNSANNTYQGDSADLDLTFTA